MAPLQLSLDAAAGLSSLHFANIAVPDLAARNCVLTDQAIYQLITHWYCSFIATNAVWQLVLKIGDYGLGRAAFPGDYWAVVGAGQVPLRWTAPRQVDKRWISIFSKSNRHFIRCGAVVIHLLVIPRDWRPVITQVGRGGEWEAPTLEDNLWGLGVLVWEFITHCSQPYPALTDSQVER